MDNTLQIKADLEKYRASKVGTSTIPSTGDIKTDLEAYRASKTAPQPEKQGFLESTTRALLSPVATTIARPFQLGAELLGASADSVDKFSNKYSAGLVAPVPRNFGDVKKDIGRAGQTVALGLGPVSGGASFGAGVSLEQGNDVFSKETALNTGLGLFGGKALDLVGKPLLNGAGVVIGKITPQILQDIGSKGASAVQKFMATHNILPQGGADLLNQGAQKLETIANEPFKSAGNVAKKVLPAPGNMMNRVARLTPTQATNFKKLSKGESHGEYLTRTGNFGTPEEIVQKEATKFANSLQETDDALAKISGVHKSKQLDMVLDDLAAREARIGVDSPETARIDRLYRKNKTTGLTMSEANEAKRLYERDVKLGYQKENNSEGIDRATRLDTALRNWQFGIADKNGLKNLRDLNKQTQLSRFIVDKLGKQIGGKTGNEAINLTDWIILSNGDPTAIASFLLKKSFSNKGLQSSVAKVLSGTPEAPITAKFGETSGLPARIEGRDYSTAIPLRAPRSKPTIEPQARKINRSDSLQDQRNARLRLPAPTSSTQGETMRLPQSIRETNLGLDEIRGANIRDTRKQQLLLGERAESIKLPSQTNRKVSLQSESPQDKLKISYTETISQPQKKSIGTVRDINKKLNKENTSDFIKSVKEGNEEASRLTSDKVLKQVKDRDLIPQNATPDTKVKIYRVGTGEIKDNEFVSLTKTGAEKYLKDRKGAKVYETTTELKNLVKSKGLGDEFVYSPESTPNKLIQEAKKYKSAEEFVKAQGTPVYHGGDLSKITKKPLYTTTNKSVANTYGGKLNEVFQKPGKVYDLGNKIEDRISNGESPEEIIPKLNLPKDVRYVDFVHPPLKENGAPFIARVSLYPIEDIQTKSQLTDIWKNANKKSLPKASDLNKKQ